MECITWGGHSGEGGRNANKYKVNDDDAL
jgi:hypothetical protein